MNASTGGVECVSGLLIVDRSSISLEEIKIYHVSEQSDIRVFEPRQVSSGESLVWAIDDEHLRNYLVPRECPRVTFYAGPGTAAADRERFLGSSAAVLAIESAWFERVRACRLFCYHLPAGTFECSDKTAEYFVSRTAVTPTLVDVIHDPVVAILRRGVELRVVPDLWPLRDAVIGSTLQFSIIRWRNASPRRQIRIE